MIGYLIDAEARMITRIDYEYGEMRRYLPGGICIGWAFANGDVLYVDDEGLLHPAQKAFRIKCRPDGQPMMSNGMITGRDVGRLTLAPRFTLVELHQEIEFLDLETALGWFRARAHEPAMSIQFGEEPPSVRAHWDEFLRNLEGEPGYSPYQDESLVGRRHD